MKKLLFLFIFLSTIAQAQTPDATIKTNTNTWIRTAPLITGANEATLFDQLTNSKLSRVENNTASGTNTYTISISWVTSYSNLILPIKFTNANSGASTLNINGLGAKALKKSGSSALVSGDINTNQVHWLSYDGTNFQVLTIGGIGLSSFSAISPLNYNSGTGAYSFPSWPSNSSGVLTNDGSGILSWGASVSSFQTLTDGPGSFTGKSLNYNRVNAAETAEEYRTPSQVLSDISGVSTSRTINTTSPITGGGDLSADRTIAINNSAADGSTKGAASFTASDFDATSGNISLDYTNGQAASGSNKGFLTSTDWTTFNGKQSAITFGTGVQTALGVNTGSSGAFVVNGGALGTPSMGNAANLTGLPLTTGVTGNLPYANFSNGGGLSVVGRSANSSGVQADITGTTDQVLLVNGAGTTLGFGSIDLSKSATVGSSVLAVANGGTGLSSIGTNNTFLQSNGTTLNYNDFPSRTRKSFYEIRDNTIAFNFYGDSFGTSFQATSTIRGFYSIVAKTLTTAAENNYSVGSRGWLVAASSANTNISVNAQNPTITWCGFNDIRRNGSTTTLNSKTSEKLKCGIRVVTANAWLKSAVAANNASVTTSGTWSTSSGVFDKASGNLGGLVRTSTANGATLTWTGTTASDYESLVIGTFATDEVTTTGGDFTVTVDGTLYTTYSGKNKTDGISDGANNNSIMPNAIFITGITAGSHTVVVTTTSTATVRIDYFGVLKDIRFVPPVLINGSVKLLAAGYAVLPGGSDAVMDQGNAAQLSTVNEIQSNYSQTGYFAPIYFIDPNESYWNPNTCIGADNVHPNDLGYFSLAEMMLTVLKPAPTLKKYFQNYNVDNGADIGMSITLDTYAINVNRLQGSGLSINTGRAQAQYSINGATLDGSHHWKTSAANNTTPTETMTLDKNGVLILGNNAVGNTEIAQFRKDQNAATRLYLLNATSGTAALSSVEVSPLSSGLNSLSMRAWSAGFTSFGLNAAGKTGLVSDYDLNLFTQSTNILTLGTNATAAININSSQRTFFGGATSAASIVEIAAGTASVAPLGLTSGTDLSSPTAGKFYFNGTRLGFSPSTTIKRFPLTNDATPSNGQIPIGNGTDYTVANITGSNGVKVTNGSGTIALSATTTIIGSATNDNPTAGNLGEGIQSLVAVGSAISLTTATAANITSISLTAGDWEVEGNVNFTETVATVSSRTASVTSTSATLSTDGTEVENGVQSTLVTEKNSCVLPKKRFSLSGTTTVYLVGSATFSAGTCAGYGYIKATRIR